MKVLFLTAAIVITRGVCSQICPLYSQKPPVTELSEPEPCKRSLRGCYSVYIDGESVNAEPVLKIESQFVPAEEAGSRITLFPNPALSFFEMRFDPPAKIDRVRIVDLSGKLMYESALPEEAKRIDVSGFHTGTYLVQVGTKEKTAVVQLIIQ